MKYENIVLSGGSIKGYSYLGIMKCLEEYNIINNLKNIIGTSIGSIFGAIICMGISYDEIIYIINRNIEINDISFDNLMENNGFCKGLDFEKMIEEVITIKYDANITLKELYDKTRKNLYISATNLNKHCLEYLSHHNHPDLELRKALRMAITIPFVFETRKYKNTIYVDGALMKNISYNDVDPKKTLCLLLNSEESTKTTENINGIEDYMHNVMICIKNKMDEPDKRYDNIKIICKDINILNFNLSYKQKLEMIKNGYITLKTYLKKKL